MNIFLSDTEKELYEFIKSSKVKVTVELINKKLSNKHLGALGKLLGKNLIISKKDRKIEIKNIYGSKLIKYYTIINKENKK